MRAIGIFPFILVACTAGCGQDVTTAPADCGAAHEDAVARADATDFDPLDGGAATDGLPTFDSGGSLDAQPADAGPLACHVDRFTRCEDPTETRPNNESSSPTYRSMEPGRGCTSNDDVIHPGTDMFASRVCQTEPGDWYEYTFIPCDTNTMVIELRVRVTTPCERSAWSLTVQNRPCDGTDPNVSCTWDGEWRVIRALIPPASTIGLFKFGIEQPGNTTAFDYEWTVEIR